MDTTPNENDKSKFERFVEGVETYSEGVNRNLALIYRLGKAVKDSATFVVVAAILIVFVRTILWIHNTIPFL